MRKSSLLLLGWALLVVLCGVMTVHAVGRSRAAETSLSAERGLVRRLALTDLCLVTEASYTRHLSLSDIFTPFQDHPAALEHFPSGALLPPSGVTRRTHGTLAGTSKKHP